MATIRELSQHRQLLALVRGQAGILDAFYTQQTRLLAKALQNFTLTSTTNVWAGNIGIEKRVNAILRDMGRDYKKIVKAQMERAILMNNGHVDDMLAAYLKGVELAQAQELGYAYRNNQAITGWVSRRVGGMGLSARVWRIDEQTKAQMETFLKEGLADGRGAKKMATDLKQYLKEPDKRFRRVRDKETGKLKLSAPAKAYHPGRGVYRSSYANALRVARNEVNLAYRENDYLRRQSLDFVKGIRVNLSPSHIVTDICDDLMGEYPKNFRFSGWHPNCMCYTTTILEDKDAFISRMNGRPVPGGDVTGIPQRAQDYLNENAERIKGWSNKPYFLENFKGTKEGFALRSGIGAVATPPAGGTPPIISTTPPVPTKRDVPMPAKQTLSEPAPFVPAADAVEAANRIKMAGVGEVNLTGLNKRQYNAILKAIEDEASFSPLELQSVGPKGRRGSSQAIATYWSGPNVRYITWNKRHWAKHTPEVLEPYDSLLGKAENHLKTYLKQVDDLKAEGKSIDIYKHAQNLGTLRSRIKALAEKVAAGAKPQHWSMSASAATLDESIYRTMVHEIGHHRHQWQLEWTRGFKYDVNLAVTEYGRTNFKEYFTEWYTKWRVSGDEGVPEDLLKIFRSLKGRKPKLRK